MYSEIEKASLAITVPKDGDYVEYAEGKFARISRIHQDNSFQISNKVGVLLWNDGTSQASGCTWDSDIESPDNLTLNRLKLTDKQMQGRYWKFGNTSLRNATSVNFDIAVKVWALEPETNEKENT